MADQVVSKAETVSMEIAAIAAANEQQTANIAEINEALSELSQ
jgi:methyl-accepting chemotaxis protein